MYRFYQKYKTTVLWNRVRLTCFDPEATWRVSIPCRKSEAEAGEGCKKTVPIKDVRDEQDGNSNRERDESPGKHVSPLCQCRPRSRAPLGRVWMVDLSTNPVAHERE